MNLSEKIHPEDADEAYAMSQLPRGLPLSMFTPWSSGLPESSPPAGPDYMAKYDRLVATVGELKQASKGCKSVLTQAFVCGEVYSGEVQLCWNCYTNREAAITKLTQEQG